VTIILLCIVLLGGTMIRDRGWTVGTRRSKGSLRAASTAAITIILGLASAAQAVDTASDLAPGGDGDVPGCVPVLPAGSQNVTLTIDGRPREVIVHVPDADLGSRLPAVVAFHGFSSFATDMELVSGLSDLADDGAFVVAYPQGLGSPSEWHFEGNMGYDLRDMEMVRDIIRTLVEQACVDPARVFLAGHSMGGGMASDATCRMADQVAGVVLVAALWFELPCEPTRPVPVVALHALDDPVLPYTGGPIGGVPSGIPEQLAVEAAIGAWARHDGCGPIPEESTLPGGGVLLTWPDCAAPVELHRLPRGGHDWPPLASTLIAEMATGG
jgi:polyhydroxybutyrate depolymerase